MPRISNNRPHVQVFGLVRLEPGATLDITQDQVVLLQASEGFRRAQARGWVAMRGEAEHKAEPQRTAQHEPARHEPHHSDDELLQRPSRTRKG